MTAEINTLTQNALDARQGIITEIIIGRGGQLAGMNRNSYAQNNAFEAGLQSVPGVGKNNVNQL